MYNKLLIAICVLSLSLTAHAAIAKKIRKTVVTEETDANGKIIKKTETTETDAEVEKASEDESEPDMNAMAVPDGLKTINESWYTLWGLGFAGTNYSGDLGDAYEVDENSAGADKSVSLSMDLLGFYWPLEGHKTMLGFIINGSSDSVKLASGLKQSITTSLLGFSAHHFFGKNIGDGWFIRGDAGLARSTIDFEYSGTHYNDASNARLGFLVGGGYGFALGRETRLLVGLYYRPIPKAKFTGGAEIKGSVTSFTAGFLF
jgi:hypothetical protein